MLTLLQSTYDYSPNPAAAAGVGILGVIFGFILYFFLAFCLYRIFQKAGVENPWFAFIPILNLIPYFQITKKPMWWLVLLIIPFVNFVIAFIIMIRLAKFFGKSTLFGILSVFLPYITFPILAFGNAQYNPNALPDETGKTI